MYDAMSTYTVTTIARGYRVYRSVWEAAVGHIFCYASLEVGT